MWVKVLVSWAGHDFSYTPGDIVDLHPEEAARAQIAAGHAVAMAFENGAPEFEFDVPTFDSISPEYVKGREDLIALRRRDQELTAEIARVEKLRTEGAPQ